MSLKALSPLRSIAPRKSYATQNHQAFPYPAPVKGLDFMMPLNQMDPQTAIKLSNVLVRNYGLEFRSGWKRWSTLIPGEVRTLMPYNPPRGLGVLATQKLFAACSNGTIYDVTAQTNEVTVPPVSVVIPGQLEPGEFSWTNYATPTNNYLCVCSAGGGYWTYDATGGWVDQTGNITGPAGAAAISFDFVMSWKNRLMFIKDLTADVYILGVNAIIGAATNFDFGPLLIHGGDLKAMASWTMDGGDGVDDKLVLVGSEGDLLIYEGTDPTTAATFRIVGRWFIGPPPSGRRFLSRYGGDLAMITQYGIIYLSKLLQAKGEIAQQEAQESYRINPVLAKAVRDTRSQQYWELRTLPFLECLFINAPDSGDLEFRDRQFVMDINSRGWSTFDSVQMLTCEVFTGALYFGTLDGKVGRAFDGTAVTDGVLSNSTPGNDIAITVQTAFVAPGDPVRLKAMKQMQLTFQGFDKPVVTSQLNMDWSGLSTPGSPSFLGAVVALWDQAIWDQGLWQGGAVNTFKSWVGVEGLGNYASLVFTARGLPRTYFTNWLLVTESGGLM